MMKMQQKLEKSPSNSHFRQKVPVLGQKMLILGPIHELTFLKRIIRLVLTRFYLLSLIFYQKMNPKEFKLEKSTKYSHFF